MAKKKNLPLECGGNGNGKGQCPGISLCGIVHIPESVPPMKSSTLATCRQKAEDNHSKIGYHNDFAFHGTPRIRVDHNGNRIWSDIPFGISYEPGTHIRNGALVAPKGHI